MLYLITLIKVLGESHRLIMTVSFLVQSGSDGSLWHLCCYCGGHSFFVFITGSVVWLCANKLKLLSSVNISLCSHDHMHMTCWSVLAVHQVRQDNWGKLLLSKNTDRQCSDPTIHTWSHEHKCTFTLLHDQQLIIIHVQTLQNYSRTPTHTYHMIGLVLVNDRQKYSISFLKTEITKN